MKEHSQNSHITISTDFFLIETLKAIGSIILSAVFLKANS